MLFDYLDVVTTFINLAIDEDVHMILQEGIPVLVPSPSSRKLSTDSKQLLAYDAKILMGS